MEVVASSFAIVSLSIQIVESVKKIHRFLDSAADAPSYVRRLIDELDAFKEILEVIAQDIEEAPHPVSSLESIQRCLATCNTRIQKITSVVDELEQGFSKGGRQRHWASVKAAFKKEKIAEFRAELESAKHILSMAVQSLSYRVQRWDARVIHHSMDRLLSNSNNTSAIGSRTVLDVEEEGFISIRWGATVEETNTDTPTMSPIFRGRQTNLQRQRCSFMAYRLTPYHLACIVLQPLQRSPLLRHRLMLQRLLCSLSRTSGFTYVSTTSRVRFRACGDWNQDPNAECTETAADFKFVVPFWQRGLVMHWVPRHLSVHCVVPHLSPIFDLCRQGDVQKVMIHFAKGWASPHDTTPAGYTLLHAAVAYGQAQVCELLLDFGVDESECSNYALSIFLELNDYHSQCIVLDRKHTNTFAILRALLRRGFDPSRGVGKYLHTLTFFHRQWDPEIYQWVIDQEYVHIDLAQLDSNPYSDYHETPLMMQLMHLSSTTRSRDLIKSLLRAGVDVHAHDGSKWTALSRAILSDRVDLWLELLSQSGFDLRVYMLKEQAIHGKEHAQLVFGRDPNSNTMCVKNRLVRYHYGLEEDLCWIYLLEGDAIEWFSNGIYDLDIFSSSDTVPCCLTPKRVDCKGVRHFRCAWCRSVSCAKCGQEKTPGSLPSKKIKKHPRNPSGIQRMLINGLGFETTTTALASSVNLRWIYGLSLLLLLRYFSLKLVAFAIVVAYVVQLCLITRGSKINLTKGHGSTASTPATHRKKRRARRRKSRKTD